MKKMTALLCVLAMLMSLVACGNTSSDSGSAESEDSSGSVSESEESEDASDLSSETQVVSEKEYIESTLNLANNPDFYPYQEEVGAVGCYLNEDGTYTTTVTIDGEEVALSDGAWGCIAYSAITSLYEADMALAFEYYLDVDYEFGSAFQAQLEPARPCPDLM